jgi:hypothetical protein
MSWQAEEAWCPTVDCPGPKYKAEALPMVSMSSARERKHGLSYLLHFIYLPVLSMSNFWPAEIFMFCIKLVTVFDYQALHTIYLWPLDHILHSLISNS